MRNKRFQEGDRIYIDPKHRTKHAGHKATVIKVGIGRLTVQFDDKNHKGKYVDIRDATLLVEPDKTTSSDTDELGEMLSHLAISAGHGIRNYAKDDRKQVLQMFIKTVEETISV